MIDFDDLDEAVEAAVAAGESLSEAALAARAGYCGGFLPAIPRSPPHLPGFEDLPMKLQKNFPEDVERQVQIRLFVFYGAGDQFAGWSHFMREAPSWCEVAVHEWPFHGIRENEPPACSLDELVIDAMEGLRPALKQHARGGCIAGAPFAFAGHSIGVLQMIRVAAQVRATYGMEPAAVFVIDRASPEHSLSSERGREMIQDDLEQFVCIIDPRVAQQSKQLNEVKGRRLLKMWQELRFQDSTMLPGWHQFHCPLHVFIAMQNWMEDAPEIRRAMTHDQRQWHEYRASLLGSRADSYALFDRTAYDTWKSWASAECHFHEIDANHVGIKSHESFKNILWRTLGESISRN